MGKILLSCVFVFGAFGCGDASKKVEELADRACACKDKACADGVIDDFVTWAKENKNARGDQKKAEAAVQKMMSCAMKAGGDPSSMLDKLKAAQ